MARVAIGSVSALALGALLLGSAPYWLHRGTTQAGPWGAIASPAPTPSDAAASADDRAQLLKLAALKSGAAPEAQAAPPAPVAAEAAPAPMVAADPTPAEAAPAMAPPVVATEPAAVQVATAEDAASALAPAADETAAKPGLVNINTASASALDHLPGAGRIGHTIVSHRPYKSVKDLVNKRVLRLSDYQKIQSLVSAD